MEVPHGIPITRRIFKSWREFKEMQSDSAGNYNPYASVTEILQELNWETLATRRKTADFSVVAHGSYAFKFVVPRAKKDIFKFSFFPRTINEWNSLPKDIVKFKVSG